MKIKQLILQGPLNNQHEPWFKLIAHELLFNCALKAADVYYAIKEIEFYYRDEPHHEDFTTYGYMPRSFKKDELRVHRHKQRQYIPLTWFIHYSGIDLVIGNEKNPGGILIRAIERKNDGEGSEIIDGPLKVLLELMNQSVDVFGSPGPLLELVATETPVKGALDRKQRVGINDGKDRPYNFFVS